MKILPSILKKMHPLNKKTSKKQANLTPAGPQAKPCPTLHLCDEFLIANTRNSHLSVGNLENIHDMDYSKIVVPQDGWFIMENPIKMDDLGVLLLSETSIYTLRFFLHPQLGYQAWWGWRSVSPRPIFTALGFFSCIYVVVPIDTFPQKHKKLDSFEWISLFCLEDFCFEFQVMFHLSVLEQGSHATCST